MNNTMMFLKGKRVINRVDGRTGTIKNVRRGNKFVLVLWDIDNTETWTAIQIVSISL